MTVTIMFQKKYKVDADIGQLFFCIITPPAVVAACNRYIDSLLLLAV